jgi:hypothetical protein
LGGGAGGECAGAVVEGRLVLAFNFVTVNGFGFCLQTLDHAQIAAAALATAVVSVL